jgi:superfamily II DNA or RNA helicase
MQTGQNLLSAYNKLEPNEKSVLNLFILIYKPVYVNEAVSLFAKLNKSIAQGKITPIIQKLIGKKLLINVSYATVAVDANLLILLFPQLWKDSPDTVKIVFERFPRNEYSILSWDAHPHIFVREFIIGCYTNNKKLKDEMIKQIELKPEKFYPLFLLFVEFKEYYPILLELPHDKLLHTLFIKNGQNITNFHSSTSLESIIKYLIEESNISIIEKSHFKAILAEIYLFKGNFTKASELVASPVSSVALKIQSNLYAFNGNYAKAAELLSMSFLFERTGNSKAKRNYDIVLTLSYFLSLLIDPSLSDPKEIARFTKECEKGKLGTDCLFLPFLYKIQRNKFLAERALSHTLPSYKELNEISFASFIILICQHLITGKIRKNDIAVAEDIYKTVKQNGQLLLQREMAYLLSIYIKGENYKKVLKDLNSLLSFPCLLSRIEAQDSWEESLDGLLNLFAIKTKDEKKIETNRIVYFVNFDNGYVQPILQTLTAGGSWSKGRNIALKRMKEGMVEGMSEQDRKIASTIKHHASYYYGGNDYSFDFEKLYPELAGHPYLYLFENPDIPIELVNSQPEITTEITPKGYVLKIDVTETEKKYIIRKETNTRYKLIQLTEQHRNIIRIIEKGQLVIPVKGKDKLMQAIGHLSGIITIHSDLAESNSNMKTVEPDSRIRVQLLPVGDSLKAEMFVKPFGSVPPYTKPGKGGTTIYGQIENEKCQVIRDLVAEAKFAETLNNDILVADDTDFSEGPVVFEDPYQCLNLLETLQKHQDIAVVEWPEGERFKVKKFASFGQLSLSVKGKGHWFEMEGELKIDEDTVLSIKELLELSRKSSGRFVELKKGEFLSLTEELKKRLDELNAYISIDKSGVKMNKFAAHAIAEIAQNAESFKTDKNWKDFQKLVKESDKLQFNIPATLEAELRPYQEEGYRWMARLAQWNAGACLADDMGLGKTVQAIAILLNRAEAGPALVVCPASVVGNWINEIRKFAPTLNPINLRNTNRDDTFGNIAPFDVLIITYGLLQSEEERIGKQEWSTAILDEAHAIKNTQTKSSKAAMNINAGFRLMLTGTPIQNHLGELWNLFNFCNPGLLGTLQQYNERFVNPLKIGNQFQKQHLKKLISPFILRRTKNTVLDELPPKTEITHTIELSDKEMAFYEALRRQAIETIETSDAPQGQQHLKALAEITRLRLACCNTALVDKTLDLPSSKLDAFFEIIDELIENKHRALVFSQFIGHLAIVRKELEKRKINYQYLDGSTPLPEREASVKAFQTGKGDLFLISLKAGGLGLNLTAADYVIHLDPWWNPAIEDQASDRAHRIGQNRPVTIYRLVAKNTIEEKILQLHSTKRDMADSLLEGTDQSAKLSTKDLLLLLKDV